MLSTDPASPPWPAHRGDVARLIRERDWAACEIGPVESWPAALRAALDIILVSPVAMSVSWASPATFFYNDAFIPIAGRRHPGLLGGSAQRDWPEVAEQTGEILRRIAAGESVLTRGQTLEVLRDGVAGPATFDVGYSPLFDEHGHPGGLFVVVAETTELVRAQAGLRESEARFRQFADASSEVLWIRDARTLDLEYVGPAFERIFGAPIASLGRGEDLEGWLALIEPADRDQALAAFERVRGGERVSHEFRIRRIADGAQRWIGATDFPLLDGEGRVQRIGGIGSDITEAKRAAERNALLVAELQHRTRNLLTVVTAVASRTLRRGGSVDSFETRLAAIGRAHGLLSQQGPDTVDVGDLVRAELAAHAEVTPPKVTLAGPQVQLTAGQVQNFALAVHELTTNAVKYGALCQPDGRLAVSWSVSAAADGEPRRLIVEWRETGVVVAPSPRRGFGRELIERALAYASETRTHYILSEDGVRCRFDLPLG